jgi:hypothetical protein
VTRDRLTALDQVLVRASDPAGLDHWLRRIRDTGFCSQPVRLIGARDEIDPGSGEILSEYSTDDEPDGQLMMACRSRRASRCPACSSVYAADAYQLIAAGMVGGKGVPEFVQDHPQLFVTLTAPGFGSVHSTRERGCTAAKSGFCKHGETRYCRQLHGADDVLLGQPLCRECFDYEGALLWNALAPEMWRRTLIGLHRALAEARGLRVRDLNQYARVRYAKVAEFQKRGLVHFHAVIRLDGPRADAVSQLAGDWLPELQAALDAVVARTTVQAPEGFRPSRWGRQLDVRQLGDDSDPAARLRLAGYIAKYATKGADAAGLLDRPVRTLLDLEQLGLNPHLRHLVATALRLGARRELRGLRIADWAHNLGFGGHWCTRSRLYSATLSQLRETRQSFRRAALDLPPGLSVGNWAVVGVGHPSEGDRWLVETARQQVIAEREAAKLARLDDRRKHGTTSPNAA